MAWALGIGLTFVALAIFAVAKALQDIHREFVFISHELMTARLELGVHRQAQQAWWEKTVTQVCTSLAKAIEHRLSQSTQRCH